MSWLICIPGQFHWVSLDALQTARESDTIFVDTLRELIVNVKSNRSDRLLLKE
jgi:hypothetical protein